MKKLSSDEINTMNLLYPGLANQVEQYECMVIPSCPLCSSSNTAKVVVEITGRTMSLTRATTKIHLIPNSPRGQRYCYECKSYFIRIQIKLNCFLWTRKGIWLNKILLRLEYTVY